jgi:hypothetical protein
LVAGVGAHVASAHATVGDAASLHLAAAGALCCHAAIPTAVAAIVVGFAFLLSVLGTSDQAGSKEEEWEKLHDASKKRLKGDQKG